MDNFSCTWKIENFTLCVNKKDGFVSSPTFIAHSLEKTAWFLQLYPYGDGNNTPVTCYLNRSDADELGKNTITINFNFSFVLADGSKYSLETAEKKDFYLNQRHGCNLRWRDDILKEKNILLPRGTLTLRCYMQSCKTDPSAPQNNSAIKSLAHYLYDEKPDAWTTILPPEMYNSADGILRNLKRDLCSYSKGCTVLTRVKMDTRSFIWKLKDFSELQKHEKVSISLTSAAKNNPSLLLTFYLDNENESVDDEHVQIEIRLKKNTTTIGIVSKCQITVLDNRRNHRDYSNDQYFFEAQKKDEVWKFPTIIKKSKIICDKDVYLKNDTLSLLCEFSMSDGETLSQIKEIVNDFTKVENEDGTMENLMKMRDDFSALMDDAKLSDVTLVMGKKEISAHKAILSARSPVFKAMFESDMSEKESGIVNVTDLDLDTLTRMLTYMYGGTMGDLQCESAAKLYSAADKYQCLGIKDVCANFLKKNLSVANVCDVFILADMHKDKDLVTSVHDFILKHVPETLGSEEWKIFLKSKSHLAGELLYKLGLMYTNN